MSEENGYATAAEMFGQCGVRRFKDVSVLGATYRLQSIDAKQHEKFVRDNSRKGGEYTGNLRLLVMCLVDSDDHQLFTEDDISRLKGLDTRLVVALAEECLQHSGLTVEEEPEKN